MYTVWKQYSMMAVVSFSRVIQNKYIKFYTNVPLYVFDHLANCALDAIGSFVCLSAQSISGSGSWTGGLSPMTLADFNEGKAN